MGNLTDILTRAQLRARELDLPYAGAVTPSEAFVLLQNAPGSRLIDVRTRAEWDWVGRIPGAVEIEWMSYPGNQANPYFLTQLKQCADPEALILFICRSGARSHNAAGLACEAGYTAAFNVLEGFEGDKDANGQRGHLNGWRHAGLPWQS